MKTLLLLVLPFVLAAHPTPARAVEGAAAPVLTVRVVDGAAQTPPIATPGTFIAWDYADASLTGGSVVRFEMRIDGGTWSSVGIPTTTIDITGGKTYMQPVPALQPGNHSVSVRACNVDVCSYAAGPFDFKLVIVPDSPTNLGIRSSGGE